MHGLAQLAGPRHVHAVIVLGRQVHGRVQAAVEGARGGVVRQQFGGGKAMALGLEHMAGVRMQRTFIDASQGSAFADAAVGRHQQHARIRIGHAHAGFECAGEERIETFVGVRIGFRRFGQIDTELADDRVDQPLLEARSSRVRQLAHQRRQQAVRQDVRQRSDNTHFDDACVNAVMSAAIALDSSGGWITPAMRPCGSSTARAAE